MDDIVVVAAVLDLWIFSCYDISTRRFQFQFGTLGRVDGDFSIDQFDRVVIDFICMFCGQRRK